jgi:hypothetical protein
MRFSKQNLKEKNMCPEVSGWVGGWGGRGERKKKLLAVSYTAHNLRDVSEDIVSCCRTHALKIR